MLDKILYYLDRVSLFWWVCVALAFVFTVVFSRRSYTQSKISKLQALSRSIFIPYIIMIFVFTIFIRLPNNSFCCELIPFWSYREILANGDKELIFENISNIVIFIPFGILLPMCGFKEGERKSDFTATVKSGFLLSFIIEITQFITKFGYFEFDDIFHNTLGVLIGVLINLTIKTNKKSW